MGSSCSSAEVPVAEKGKRQEIGSPKSDDTRSAATAPTSMAITTSSSNFSSGAPMAEETPSVSASDHQSPVPQLESPAINPLTAMVPSRRASVTSRPASSSFSSRRGSSASPRSDEVPRNLRRFLSDSDLRHGSLGASDRTNIYIPGDVPDLNMLPVASAISDYTNSDISSPSSRSMKTDSLPTPLSKSLPDSLAGSIVPIVPPALA